MTTQDQVSSLEQSKRLKESGVKQDSLFYWVKGTDGEWSIIIRKELNGTISYQKGEHISAYTVAELGEILPHFIKIKGVKYQLFESVSLGESDNPNSKRQWFMVYVNELDYTDNAPIPFLMHYNEADARAKMLIYLIENNLIKL